MDVHIVVVIFQILFNRSCIASTGKYVIIFYLGLMKEHRALNRGSGLIPIK